MAAADQQPVFIETSAIVAILAGEPEARRFLERITTSNTRLTGVNNAIEACFVLAGTTDPVDEARALIDDLLTSMQVDTVGVDADLFPDVMDAFSRFGKGRGHPAQLNFGDCISYALARRHQAELVYKGNDFALAGL